METHTASHIHQQCQPDRELKSILVGLDIHLYVMNKMVCWSEEMYKKNLVSEFGLAWPEFPFEVYLVWSSTHWQSLRQ